MGTDEDGSFSALRTDQMLSAGPFLIRRVVAIAIQAKQSAPIKATTSTPMVAALPCAHMPSAGNSGAMSVVSGIAIVAAAHSHSRCTAERAAPPPQAHATEERKSGVVGKRGYGRVGSGGRRHIK